LIHCCSIPGYSDFNSSRTQTEYEPRCSNKETYGTNLARPEDKYYEHRKAGAISRGRDPRRIPAGFPPTGSTQKQTHANQGKCKAWRKWCRMLHESVRVTTTTESNIMHSHVNIARKCPCGLFQLLLLVFFRRVCSSFPKTPEDCPVHCVHSTDVCYYTVSTVLFIVFIQLMSAITDCPVDCVHSTDVCYYRVSCSLCSFN